MLTTLCDKYTAISPKVPAVMSYESAIHQLVIGDGSTAPRPSEEHWLSANLRVFEGEATDEYDKLTLVLPLLVSPSSSGAVVAAPPSACEPPWLVASAAPWPSLEVSSEGPGPSVPQAATPANVRANNQVVNMDGCIATSRGDRRGSSRGARQGASPWGSWLIPASRPTW